MSCAHAPATVSVWKTASESTLAEVIASAAGTGAGSASGTVVSRARIITPATTSPLVPATAARVSASAAAASPSRIPATAGAYAKSRDPAARGAAAIRRPHAAHPLCQSFTVLVTHPAYHPRAHADHCRLSAGPPASPLPGIMSVPLRRDTQPISLVPVTTRTAPRRDDRAGRRTLALAPWKQRLK